MQYLAFKGEIYIMTQNEVNIIKNAVLDATEAYVDARLSVLDFVKTQIGVTVGKPTLKNGKYLYYSFDKRIVKDGFDYHFNGLSLLRDALSNFGFSSVLI